MIGQTVPHPEWRLLVDRLRQLDYGELIPHHEIVTLSGLVYGTQPYYQQMRQAIKVLLREHEMVVVSVPKVGYKRLEPQKHGQEVRRYVRLGARRIKRGSRVGQVTDMALLAEDQKREWEKAMRLVTLLKQQMGQVYRSMKGVLPPVQMRQLTEAHPKDDTVN